MDSRYDHDYVFDGPSGGAGSGRCRFCGCSDEAEGATLECPFPLRVALDAALGAWKLAKGAICSCVVWYPKGAIPE